MSNRVHLFPSTFAWKLLSPVLAGSAPAIRDDNGMPYILERGSRDPIRTCSTKARGRPMFVSDITIAAPGPATGIWHIVGYQSGAVPNTEGATP